LSTIAIILNIVHLILAVSLIVIVLLQSGKSAGISGVIAGGAETFFGKNKGRTIDAMLSRYTKFAAIAFLVTSIALYAIRANV
jgi:preprotein translocase subunit SecG